MNTDVAVVRAWWVGLVGQSDCGARLQDKNLERKVGAQAAWLRDVYLLNLATVGPWARTAAMIKVSELWVASRSGTGPQRTQILFACAENRTVFLEAAKARGFPISLRGPGHRTRGWMAYQLRRWCGPRSTNSWISLSSPPPSFFTFCWLLCQWGEEENVLFRGMLPQQKAHQHKLF